RDCWRGILSVDEHLTGTNTLSDWCARFGRINCNTYLVSRFELTLRPALTSHDARAVDLNGVLLSISAFVLHVQKQLSMRIPPRKVRDGSLHHGRLFRNVGNARSVWGILGNGKEDEWGNSLH